MLLGVDADVYLTGEMSHHQVLAAVASGKNVVMCAFVPSIHNTFLVRTNFPLLFRWSHEYGTRVPPNARNQDCGGITY